MMLSTGMCAQIACILEATARKPGNVHRFRDFDDLTYVDFLLSAAATSPVFEHADRRPVGTTVLEAIQATRQVATTNTNLGIVLLLAPLAAVPRSRDLRNGIVDILGKLTIDDSQTVFEAIRLANPGGLGSVTEEDVHGRPTKPLGEVMALAADRDLVAKQYVNHFRDVFDSADRLQVDLRRLSLEPAIIGCHLYLLANQTDTHVVRRHGPAIATELSQRAQRVLTSNRRAEEIDALDDWLRAGKINPGATADLVAASLFVPLREGTIELPATF